MTPKSPRRSKPAGAAVTLGAALALVAATQRPARADFPDKAVYVGFYGGGNLVLRGWDLGFEGRPGYKANPRKPIEPDHGGFGGLRLGLHATRWLAIEAEAAYLPLIADGTLNHGLSADVEAVFHLIKGNWTPTLEIGGGVYQSFAGRNLGYDLDPRFHVGVGLRGFIPGFVAFRLDVRDVVSDGYDNLGANNLEVTAGLDFFAWKPADDKDKDGLADKLDRCPTEAGPVEHEGCPDKDGDGVADLDDRCPDKAGKAELAGCADSDGDGIADPDDQCPEHAGPAALKGCADRDGDGIADRDDACPGVPAGSKPDAAKAGCPADTDGDGLIDEKDACADVPAGSKPDPERAGCPRDTDGDAIADEKDACPFVKGVASAEAQKNGCPPDKDADSIADDVDACPDKAGAPDPDPKKNGCPGLVRIEKNKIVILEKVFFDTGKDSIQKKSFKLLDAVAVAVKTLPPGVRVLVEGHTDNKGKPEDNQALSQRRAEAVQKYLTDKGIAPALLVAKGFGAAQPIADNNTTKGREENRRVEFHILDPDAASAPAAK